MAATAASLLFAAFATSADARQRRVHVAKAAHTEFCGDRYCSGVAVAEPMGKLRAKPRRQAPANVKVATRVSQKVAKGGHTKSDGLTPISCADLCTRRFELSEEELPSYRKCVVRNLIGRSCKPQTDPSGNLIEPTKSLSDGPGIIRSGKTGATARVSPRYAARFQNYVDQIEREGGIVSFMGGYRRGKCWSGGKHPCGWALDTCQLARGVVHAKCNLPKPQRLAAIAAAHGLFEGGKWCSNDYGHAEAGGSRSCPWRQYAVGRAIGKPTAMAGHPFLSKYQVAEVVGETAAESEQPVAEIVVKRAEKPEQVVKKKAKKKTKYAKRHKHKHARVASIEQDEPTSMRAWATR
ncbi:MAG: hypothetical protein Q7R45_08265 [Sulfuricaulis sp.]|nr:hypothetical protein [Sulfuricaulis sp.]